MLAADIQDEKGAMLEQRYGVRFAPVPLAMRFSYEGYLPTSPTFGVHGLHALWRHFSEAEVQRLVETLHPRSLTGVSFINLIVNLIDNARYGMAQRLLRLALDRLAGADVEAGLDMFRQTFTKAPAGDTFVATCRQLLALRALCRHRASVVGSVWSVSWQARSRQQTRCLCMPRR